MSRDAGIIVDLYQNEVDDRQLGGCGFLEFKICTTPGSILTKLFDINCVVGRIVRMDNAILGFVHCSEYVIIWYPEKRYTGSIKVCIHKERSAAVGCIQKDHLVSNMNIMRLGSTWLHHKEKVAM